MFTLLGWRVSYFTGKLECYLRLKKIPFQAGGMSGNQLMVKAKKWSGAMVMPLLQTPDGNYLQDTWDIIRVLESKYPSPSMVPTTPRKRVVSSLIEAWADEFWIPMAMHYRWSYPESVEDFKKEAGDALIPSFLAPRWIKNIAANKVANILIAYLPVVGVRPSQTDQLQEWTRDILSKLDAHFAVHPFLLGARPSTADCGLAGPLVPHLGRDPWPRDHLLPDYPHVQAWIRRMRGTPTPKGSAEEDWKWSGEEDENNDDIIPETLQPILEALLQEFVPMLRAMASNVAALCHTDPFCRGDQALPRRLDDVEFPLAGKPFNRRANPFCVWKAQCVVDEVAQMTDRDRVSVHEYMTSSALSPAGKSGFNDLLQLFSSPARIPRLERVDVRVRVKKPEGD